ncbi:MAG: ABC transporter ATP-binding protein [Granulosicoccus sp.]
MTLLHVEQLCTEYPGVNGGPKVQAVSDVSFSLAAGEVLGIVGESGCGKSTLARTVLRLAEPSAGRIVFDGVDITSLSRKAMIPIRKAMQVVFQDPFGALNPRHTVGKIVGEPLQVHSLGSAENQRVRVLELLSMVGLPESAADLLPHQFSGGQRQRIAIARALALQPRLLVADEAVSALDVSIQSQIINLISDLQKQFGLAILFISHDLSVIRHVCSRVAVMYLGRIVETGPVGVVMNNPQHPYTRALISAIPGWSNTTERVVLQGELPDIANPPAGCVFNTRCPVVMPQCQRERPELCKRQAGELFSTNACFRYDAVPHSELRN